MELLTLSGIIIKKQIKRGAVNALLTDLGQELVIRLDGYSGLAPSELDNLVGKRITATGTIASYVFIVANYREVSKTEPVIINTN